MGPERRPPIDAIRGQGQTGKRPISGLNHPGVCPSCGGELRFPGVLDACMACGYSGVRGAGAGPANSSRPKQAASGSVVLLTIRAIPPWAWLLALGTLAILVTCGVMSLRLPRSGVDRAIFSTATLGLGVVAVIAAQAWATPMIAADSHLLTVWDFIVTFRFWALVMKRLPRSRYPLCLLSWGLAAIVGSVLIVGGLWYWLPGKKRVNFYLQNPEVQRTPQDDTGPPQDEMISEKSVLTKPQEPTADGDDDDDPNTHADGQKPTKVQCVVLGYIPDEEGRLVGLVLGAGEKGVYRYVGVVRRGINRANEEALRARLSRYIRLKPSIPDSGISAIWVDPRVSCEVTQRGVGSASVLPNPFFKGLTPDPKEKKGHPQSTPAPAPPQ